MPFTEFKHTGVAVLDLIRLCPIYALVMRAYFIVRSTQNDARREARLPEALSEQLAC